MDNQRRREVGLKIGSQNTAMAVREDGEIKTKCIKTCIMYPKNISANAPPSPPIIGDKASEYAEAIYPLRLGVVKTDAGVKQTKDILSTLGIPEAPNVVVATPAIEINEGKRRLIKAISEVCGYKNALNFSEGLCSAAYITDKVKELLESTFLSINMGSTTTEFGCVHQMKMIHLSAHAEISGDKLDNIILNHIRNSMGDVMLNIKDVRQIKEAASLTDPKETIVKGWTPDGIMEQLVKDEIYEPIKDYAWGVATLIKNETIGSIDPQIRRFALERPLVISGGMANIEGLPELIGAILSEKSKFTFEIAYSKRKDSHIAPSIGALMIAEAVTEEKGWDSLFTQPS